MFKDEGIPIKISKDGTLPIEGEAEIEKALKEFEIKSNVDKEPKAHPNVKNSVAGGMAGFVVKHSKGLVKNQKQAEYILLAIVIIFITASLVIFLKTTSPKPKARVLIPAYPINP